MKNRFWLVLLALLAIFPAHAAKKVDFNSIGMTKTGNSVTVGPTGNIGAAAPLFDTRVPVQRAPGSWQPAGNYGVPQGSVGPTMTMTGAGEAIFPGVKYPFQAGYQVPVSLITTALSGLCSNPLVCVAVTVGSPYLLDWLTQSGARVKADGSGLERSDPNVCTVAPCFEYQLNSYPLGPWAGSEVAACQAGISALNAAQSTYTHSYVRVEPLKCYISSVRRSDGVSFGTGYNELFRRSVNPSPANWLPSSMDDIAPYIQNKPYDSKVIQEILDKGANIELPNPTVTGPTSIVGPESTTTNPDGSKTVSKTTYNFSTNQNTISNTGNTTVTTTYNIDNSVRSSSSTTITPVKESAPEKETPDPCKLDPKAIGCSTLGDAPEKEKIPTQEIPVTSTPTVFGSASGCPAPYSGSIHVLSFTKSWDIKFDPMCDLMNTLRPLFLALGAAAAAWLFMEGLKA